MTKSKFFSTSEMECKCGKKCYNLAPGFIEKLDELREAFGYAMIPTSCCRCPTHNGKEGGKTSSFHLITNSISKGTCAIDIKRKDYNYDAALICTALDLGWSIGLAKTFIHLDRRGDYGAPRVIFTY